MSFASGWTPAGRDKTMNTRAFVGIGLIGFAAAVLACNDASDDASGSGKVAAAAKAEAQLNLSHIACEDGKVTAHFVLLGAGDADPGTLTGTSNQGAFSTEPYKHSGNVWHYNVILADGNVSILTASVG